MESKVSVRVTLSVLVFAVCLPVCATADDKPYTPFAPDIARVESGGIWRVGSRWGRYRAVVRRGCSPEHCYDDLFVEWVEVSEGGDSKVIATKHVAEVPGLTHVSELKFFFPGKGTRLEVQHEGGDGVDKFALCLDLEQPGTYTTKKGRCGRAAEPRVAADRAAPDR
jgi:hypothetical protein